MRKKAEDFSVSNNKDRDKFFNAMSSEQHELFDSIQSNIFTFCEATCGSGKTQVSVAAMLSLLESNAIDKIIYIQKPSERYLSQGYLPGNMEEKSQLLFLPFYDSMHNLGFFDSSIDCAVSQGIINLVTDCSLRGVNIENAGVIVDESQNMNMHTLKLIFTRCHDNCHIAMLGDRQQKDNHKDNKVFYDYGNYLAENFGRKVILTRNFRGRFSKAAEAFNG